MKFSFSLASSLLLSSALVNAVVATESLAECPVVVPVNIGMHVPSTLSNRILEMYDITIQSAVSGTISYANVGFYQSVIENGSRTLYVQLQPKNPNQAFPTPSTALFLVIKKKSTFKFTKPLVPLLYTIFTSSWTVDNTNTDADAIVLNSAGFTVTPYSIYALIVELGHTTKAEYIVASPISAVLTATLESDIFATNPVTAVANGPVLADGTYTVPDLPTNRQAVIACIRRLLKKSVRHIGVPSDQLSRMAFGAFLSEVRSYFRCDSPCTKTICDNSTYVDYTLFIAATIRLIAATETRECPPIVFCGGSTNNQCAVVNQDICKYASNVSTGVSVGVSVEARTLFGDICSCSGYTPLTSGLGIEVQVDTTVEVDAILPTEVQPEDLIKTEDDMDPKKKFTVKKRRAAAKVKSSTSVSTYGWYVAGGVVAVSVAVVVYIFIL